MRCWDSFQKKPKEECGKVSFVNEASKKTRSKIEGNDGNGCILLGV